MKKQILEWLTSVRADARAWNSEIDVRVGRMANEPGLHFFEGDVQYDAYHCYYCADGTVSGDDTDLMLRALAAQLLADLKDQITDNASES